jgi:hypothetical protein
MLSLSLWMTKIQVRVTLESVLEQQGSVELDSGDHLGLGRGIKHDVTERWLGR